MSPIKERLFIGEYLIDIQEGNGVFYYSVMHRASNDILSIGDEPTRERAQEKARWVVAELSGEAEMPSLFPQEDSVA